MQTRGCGDWEYYVLQRSENANGFHASVGTLSSVLFVLRTIFNREHSTRARSIGLFPANFFEIGLHTIAAAVRTRPRTFEMLFRRDTGMVTDDWLRENVVVGSGGAAWSRGAAGASQRAPHFAPGELRVTPEGRASIEAFPDGSLKKFWVEKLTVEGFIESRHRFARSFAVCSVARRVFNAPYPSLARTVFAIGEIPVLHSNFDHGRITATEPSPYGTLRLSPTVTEYLGPTLYGESIVSIGAITQALIANIAPVRAFFEALIEAEDSEAERPMRTGAELEALRRTLEERFTAIAPPAVSGHPTAGGEWISALTAWLDAAKDAGGAPVDAIPWF
jgi:hypothetical protein